MTIRKPTGVIVPMITPFSAAGDVDAAAVGRVVDYLAAGGMDGLFLLGTTGESASMTVKQKRDLVAAAVKAVRGRMAIYAGISSNVLAEAVQAAHEYADLGVDALFVLPPNFYPVPEAALEDWFRQLLDRVPLDLLLYNIPLTTHISLPMAVVERLADHPRLLGIKDSEPDTGRLHAALAIAKRRPGFHVLSGTNKLFVEALAQGAHGIIPAAANLEPVVHRDLCRAVRAGQQEDVERLKASMNEVLARYNGPTLGESLAKLKALMAAKGLCEPHMLPPLRRWVA
ncbi:MAG: dihydrodipicolinate synthase family protein [Lentisphaerae bacterium]|nr:dihydrodipicolinate synthase family protein [Lentisphaerota bacterium]